MTEDLLQFIWLHRLYDTQKKLLTTEGEEIIVIHAGTLNTHAGPDFIDAKLKIGSTIWAGNIELHLKSSDWNKHLHQENKNYSQLILHVVYEYDTDVKTYDNTTFPTLELKDYIYNEFLNRHYKLLYNVGFIPCEHSFHEVTTLTIQLQIDRVLIERLEEKMLTTKELLTQYNNNWQEVFYIKLARAFGLHINQDPFEQVALNTPLSVFAKHKNNLLQIESLLFGQAGFLYDYFDESYPLILQKEYEHLKKLHNLTPIEKHHWKFLRLRPANFPTLRIAEFAQLIVSSTHLFSKVIEANTIKEIEKLFQVTVSDFWLSHYTFQEKSIERNKSLGKSFIHTVIINAVIPTLFMYGKMQGKESYCEKAIEFLRQLPPEKNAIITSWKKIYLDVKNAGDTQALLQLKKHYCDTKRCLECSIGYAILK